MPRGSVRIVTLALVVAASVLALAFAGWRVTRAVEDGRPIQSPQPGSVQDASTGDDAADSSDGASDERTTGADTPRDVVVSLDDLPESPDHREIIAISGRLGDRLTSLINEEQQPDRETLAAAQWLLDELDSLEEEAFSTTAATGSELEQMLATAAVGVAIAAEVLRGYFVPLESTPAEVLERAKQIMRSGLAHNRVHIRSISVYMWTEGGVERYPEFVNKIRTMRETDPADRVAYNANRVRLPGDDW